MIHDIEFIKNYRCFKKGEKLEFRRGVNLLVGDQGTGKSTLISCIRGVIEKKNEKIVDISADPIKVMVFNFEMDSVRGKSSFDDSRDYFSQVQQIFLSHGQANNAIINGVKNTQKTLIVMDEPDMALSIRSCHKLAEIMKGSEDRECQIIAAVHNPVVISAFTQVLSLEHRRWMPSNEFIESQIEPKEQANEPH